jgi:methylphosphotriester-DNA--protein-cysteine methyltransferase
MTERLSDVTTGTNTSATGSDSTDDVTTRTEQRRFLRTTGLTHAAIRQIERARHATNLLRQGVPIVQVAHDAGYFDQAHLTRSLTRFIGQHGFQLVA